MTKAQEHLRRNPHPKRDLFFLSRSPREIPALDENLLMYIYLLTYLIIHLQICQMAGRQTRHSRSVPFLCESIAFLTVETLHKFDS